MQSSTAGACRAGVILVCLVAIPMAALFGTRVPDLVSQLLSRDWHLGIDLGLLTGEDPPGDLAPLGPETSEPPWSSGSGVANLGGRLNQSPVQAVHAEGQTGGVFASHEAPVDDAGTARLAAWQVDAGSPGVESDSPRNLSVNVDDPSSPEDASVAPGSPGALFAGMTSSGATDRRETVPVSDGPSASAAVERDSTQTPRGPLPGREQIASLERELRKLGATYYALETWGAAGQYYRFHAKVAVGGDPSCARHFEAVRAGAVQAMAGVLEQVERWRAGR